MRHELIHLSQNDPKWKNTLLGTSQDTNIGQAGCYITSFCTIADYYGHSITPDALNKQFIDKKLFSQYDLVSNDNDLQQVFPDVQYTTSYFFPNTPPTPANLTLLQQLMGDPRKTVIIEIDLRNGSVHFVPVIECNGTTVTIMNVWNGQEENFASMYGDPVSNILKYVVYEGTPKAVKTIETFLQVDSPTFEKLVTKSTSLDILGTGLNYAQSVIDQPGFGSVALDKVKQIQTSYNTMFVAWQKKLQEESSSTGQQATSTTVSPIVPVQQSVTTSTFIPSQAPESVRSIWTTDVSIFIHRLFRRGGGVNNVKS